MTGSLRVVATAGHVDHGKSALIVALTGIDPDRFAEEKRRGLTIDLGYAWTTLPGGHEVGFVDVPGHERFIRNMLAGVGPVRLVLFVVAADEGWKPQSEEHLQILDVLGVAGGVIALTKTDLVDADGLALATDEVRERVAGTALGEAPIVPVSARTGDGLDALRAALERIVAEAPAPPDARRPPVRRPGVLDHGRRHGRDGHADRRLPRRRRRRRASSPARCGRGSVRCRRTSAELTEACHVSRVAANLAGVERAPLHRGSIVCRPGAFRPTPVFEAVARPVRGVDRIPERGAFTVHTGAGETTARLRVLERRTGGEVLLRVRTDDAARPRRRRTGSCCGNRGADARSAAGSCSTWRRRAPQILGTWRSSRGALRRPTAPRSRRSASRRPGRSAPTSSPRGSAPTTRLRRRTVGWIDPRVEEAVAGRSSRSWPPPTRRGRSTKGRRSPMSAPRADRRPVGPRPPPTPALIDALLARLPRPVRSPQRQDGAAAGPPRRARWTRARARRAGRGHLGRARGHAPDGERARRLGDRPVADRCRGSAPGSSCGSAPSSC